MKDKKLNKTSFYPENFTFVDLGLPSDRLWATENAPGHYTFDEAVDTFGELLPKASAMMELNEECKCTWNDEKKGLDITGPNGNSIFLPADGYRGGVSVNDVGSHGYYWSSSFLDEYAASYASFRSDGLYPQGGSSRSCRFSVRPCKESH